jgi:hypothetical protein
MRGRPNLHYCTVISQNRLAIYIRYSFIYDGSDRAGMIVKSERAEINDMALHQVQVLINQLARRPFALESP